MNSCIISYIRYKCFSVWMGVVDMRFSMQHYCHLVFVEQLLAGLRLQHRQTFFLPFYFVSSLKIEEGSTLWVNRLRNWNWQTKTCSCLDQQQATTSRNNWKQSEYRCVCYKWRPKAPLRQIMHVRSAKKIKQLYFWNLKKKKKKELINSELLFYSFWPMSLITITLRFAVPQCKHHFFVLSRVHHADLRLVLKPGILHHDDVCLHVRR